jgi:hypothetical protein
LLNVFTPVGELVSAWCAGLDGYEVVLPCLDGSLHYICAMHVRWGVLEFGIILGNEGLDVLGGLIVQSVKLRPVAADAKKLVNFIVDFQEFIAVPRLNPYVVFETQNFWR